MRCILNAVITLSIAPHPHGWCTAKKTWTWTWTWCWEWNAFEMRRSAGRPARDAGGEKSYQFCFVHCCIWKWKLTESEPHRVTTLAVQPGILQCLWQIMRETLQPNNFPPKNSTWEREMWHSTCVECLNWARRTVFRSFPMRQQRAAATVVVRVLMRRQWFINHKHKQTTDKNLISDLDIQFGRVYNANASSMSRIHRMRHGKCEIHWTEIIWMSMEERGPPEERGEKGWWGGGGEKCGRHRYTSNQIIKRWRKIRFLDTTGSNIRHSCNICSRSVGLGPTHCPQLNMSTIILLDFLSCTCHFICRIGYWLAIVPHIILGINAARKPQYGHTHTHTHTSHKLISFQRISKLFRVSFA